MCIFLFNDTIIVKNKIYARLMHFFRECLKIIILIFKKVEKYKNSAKSLYFIIVII
jgi:hypothetical protein